MYRILYAEKADEDLTEIYSYIASDGPERAAAYFGKDGELYFAAAGFSEYRVQRKISRACQARDQNAVF